MFLALTIPALLALSTHPERADAAPVPMVLIDDQLRARPIGLLRLVSPAEGGGRRGELVFLESAPTSTAPATVTTLPLTQVLALTMPTWIVDPLSSLPPAPALVPARAAPVDKAALAARPSDREADEAIFKQLEAIANRAGQDAKQIEPPPPAPLTSFQPWVRLVDGQRLIGLPARVVDDAQPSAPGKPDNGQSLLWLHTRLGMMRLSIESISRIALKPTPAPSTDDPRPSPDSAASDVVILANGDRLTGFVDAIGESITIAPPKSGGKPAGSPIVVAIDQVAEVRLSNPPQQLRGMAAWISDGSVVAASSIDIDAAARRASLLGSNPSASVAKGPTSVRSAASFDTAEIRALTPQADRLAPLSSLLITSQIAWPGRASFDPAIITPTSPTLGSPLGADDIVLPGPMTVTWTLPEGATRVSAWLVLEERSWAWGDCVVTLSMTSPRGDGTGGAERVLSSSRLNAATPVIAIGGEVDPRATLTIKIDPGENGPVQDRVVIRHALVSVDPKPSK